MVCVGRAGSFKFFMIGLVSYYNSIMRWNILHKKRVTNNTGHIKQIQKILLANRGITGKKEIDDFMNPSLSLLNKSFFDEVEFKKTAQRIKQAIKEKEKVIIYSDYDVDGVTGTAILWELLRELHVDTLPFVPQRMIHGYGLGKKGIDSLLEEHPDTKLIITVDNGISAHEGVAYSNEKGIDVIITDHHAKPKKLPRAYAICHTTELSGSGVAFMLATMLKAQSVKIITDHIDSEHLALAAIGTIADLVPLTGANRVIVKHGLSALNQTKRLGLATLIDEIGIADKKIGTYEVGFMLGPRINASGRLDHAMDALRLLCTSSQARAWMLAAKLNKLNTLRKELMDTAILHARERVPRDRKVLIIAHESYHEGVIGLVAGGLVDEFYRPAIVLSRGDTISKASARSVRGFNIIEAISECSSLLLNAGGHPMAAGFTIQTEKLPEFEESIQKIVDAQLSDELLTRQLRVDMSIPLSHVSEDLYKMIVSMEPYGVGNPEPVFVTDQVMVRSVTQVGRDKKHLKLEVMQGTGAVNRKSAIAFGMGDYYEQLSPDKPIGIAYTVSVNEWNGVRALQLIIRDIQVS